MKPSNAEVLAVVRMVRGAQDELEALRVLAVFVARVEGETGADFDRAAVQGRKPDLVPSLLKSDVGTLGGTGEEK